MTQINPKQASIEGGTELQLSINLDDLTFSFLKHLTVGFQKKQRSIQQLNKDKSGLSTFKDLDSIK